MASVYQKRGTWYARVKDARGAWRSLAAKAASKSEARRQLRAVLHTVFARAIKAQLWTGASPVAAVETRRVPRRAYATLRTE